MMIVIAQILKTNIPAILNIAKKPKPFLCSSFCVHTRHILDLLMIRGNTAANEPVGNGQFIKYVYRYDVRFLLQQVSCGIESCRTGSDDCNPEGGFGIFNGGHVLLGDFQPIICKSMPLS